MAVPSTTAVDFKTELIISKVTSPAIVDISVPTPGPIPISIPFSSTADALGENNDVPPFSLEVERYDQTTYNGRFRKMLDVVDPRTLMCSQREIDNAVRLLKDFESQQQQQQIPGQDSRKTASYHRFDDAKLWQAKKIRDAVFHPDTNEMLPKPFRMSGFMLFNAPICVGALMATSTPSVLFFHWANQTHNALINYHNRNATQPIETSTVIGGYCGAVGGAIGVAMGMKTAIERSKSLSVVQKLKYQRFTALPAIVTAAAINVILMRGGELTTGINIYYEPDKPSSPPLSDEVASTKPNETSIPVVVGSSQIAAKKALTEMVVSRMLFPLPIFLMAPLGMSLVEPILRKNARLAIPFQSAFVFLGFGLGLPAAIALFPQIGTAEASGLEEKFQNLRDSRGILVPVFRYNKGL